MLLTYLELELPEMNDCDLYPYSIAIADRIVYTSFHIRAAYKQTKRQMDDVLLNPTSLYAAIAHMLLPA